MAEFGEYSGNQVEDILSKLNSMGDGNGIELLRQGQLELAKRSVPRQQAAPETVDNGGVSYASFGINTVEFLVDWTLHIEQVYGVKAYLSNLLLPQPRPGFGWGVVRVPGLSAQKMFSALTSRFGGKTWKWCEDIDKALDAKKEARTTDAGPYVVWCRDRIEADDELKNLSANQLAERSLNCMTEPERIALEGWFHWKTGGHLDIKNVTLSAGSRYLDGSVPSSHWSSSHGFYLGRYTTDDRHSGIRGREVVSL